MILSQIKSKSIIQKLIHPPDPLTDLGGVRPGGKRLPQMTARVERLGPDLLLDVAAEAGEGGGGGSPHALAADAVVEGVGDGGGVEAVDVGVEEGGGGGVAGVVVDVPRGDEAVVVRLGVA